MNRKSIRDHRRIPRRFRLTSKGSHAGITTWPLHKKDPETGKQAYNSGVHIASIISTQGDHYDVRNQ